MNRMFGNVYEDEERASAMRRFSFLERIISRFATCLL